MSATQCQGCGTPLPPQNYRGRPRKWCSDRCRKQTLYGRPCMDCGKPLNGSDGNGDRAAQRCLPCASRLNGLKQRAAFLERVRPMIAMRAAGLHNNEIARRLDVSYQVVATNLHRAKTREGLEVGRSPHYKAAA